MSNTREFGIIRRTTAVVLAAGLALGGSMAFAGGYSKSSYADHAVVTHVEPIYRTVRISEPHQECWDEEIYRQRRSSHHHSSGSTIVGGIIGGVIGHKIGRSIDGGRGRHGGAVLGTLVGAAIGNDHAKRHHKHGHGQGGYTTVERRCKTTHSYHTEERIDAYRVSYEYNGQIFHTRMRHRPGDRIRVNIQIIPSAY
ncbi:MAG: glycine zipper 2TM domain-containing protein [Pseudomonadota bacterium]